MKITMNTNEVSVCDGCSNCNICKYKEEAQDREKQLSEFYKGAWTQYLDIKMSCKHKRCVTSGYITSANRQIEGESLTTTATYV